MVAEENMEFWATVLVPFLVGVVTVTDCTLVGSKSAEYEPNELWCLIREE